MADGFLGRWSRRKLDLKEGKAVEPEPSPPPQPSPGSGGSNTAAGNGTASPASFPPPPGEGQGGGAPAPETPDPAPTLEDVRSLTTESDFSRYTRADVTPEVKNAALKKLFTDPRYNIQDGMDIYIDDYGKPDPMPESMLRQLAGAKFLGLFREEERKEEQDRRTRDGAEALPGPSVAQSAPALPADEPVAAVPPAVPPDHADPDLRLQQDDAARPGEPGHGTG